MSLYRNLSNIAEKAAWLEEVHRLYCIYRQPVHMYEDAIWSAWAEDMESPEAAMELIRLNRAENELQQTATFAWKELIDALKQTSHYRE